MELDRQEVLSAILFIGPAIPKKVETGRNCLFVKVEEGSVTFIGGNEFVVKQVVLNRPITTTEAVGSKEDLPKTFMIPHAELMAFKELMKEHKTDCIKLSKNDPSYLFVGVGEKELKSHHGKVDYEQPKFEYKDFEPIFEVVKGPVSDIPVMSGDLSSTVFGFNKSEKIDITFTGHKCPILFEQGDYKAILIPPVEKVEVDEDEQLTSEEFGADQNEAE